MEYNSGRQTNRISTGVIIYHVSTCNNIANTAFIMSCSDKSDILSQKLYINTLTH